MDEPTTNLDQAHAMQLIQLLKRYRGPLLMIAHDQDLLDAVCQKIWEVVSPQVAEYEGNLTSYLCTKKEQLLYQEKQWQEQQKQKRQLKKAIQTKVQKAQKSVKKPKGVGNNEAKNTKNYYQKKQKKLSNGVKVMKNRLENLPHLEKPPVPQKLKLIVKAWPH